MKVYNEVRRRPRVQTVNDMPEKTVQSHHKESEIQHILARYEQVGIVDHLRQVDLQFRDVTEFEDFADLMRQTNEARMAFMRLPPELRDVFNHSVEEWLDAAHDADKLEALRPKLERYGYMQKAAAPVAPAAVPPATPAT